MKVSIVCMGMLLGVIGLANACTTFVLQDSTKIVFGRNFDYDLGMGFVVINKRGLETLCNNCNFPGNWSFPCRAGNQP